jgi:hypothetical protein
VEDASEHLAKFLKSCTEEMKLTSYALGKTDLAQVDRSDLVCVDPIMAQVLQVDYAGYSENNQKNPILQPFSELDKEQTEEHPVH